MPLPHSNSIPLGSVAVLAWGARSNGRLHLSIWRTYVEYCPKIFSKSERCWRLSPRNIHATLESSPRFDPKHGTETTFIGVLARLPALDWPRKQGRRPDFEPLSNDHNEMSNSSPSNATAINLGIVMKALENLPADIQTLFRYHFEKGLSHSKIAKETGLPLGTVKTCLRSGLLELLFS